MDNAARDAATFAQLRAKIRNLEEEIAEHVKLVTFVVDVICEASPELRERFINRIAHEMKESPEWTRRPEARRGLFRALDQIERVLDR